MNYRPIVQQAAPQAMLAQACRPLLCRSRVHVLNLIAAYQSPVGRSCTRPVADLLGSALLFGL
jgi:hypothetical protein